MAKISKPEINCLFCEKTDCPCIRPVQTPEALIKRLEAELQRQRTRYKYPGIWDREAATVEGMKIKERLNGIYTGQT